MLFEVHLLCQEEGLQKGKKHQVAAYKIAVTYHTVEGLSATQPIQAHSPYTHSPDRHSRKSVTLLDLFSHRKRPCAACWLAQVYQSSKDCCFIDVTLQSSVFTHTPPPLIQATMPVCSVIIRSSNAELSIVCKNDRICDSAAYPSLVRISSIIRQGISMLYILGATTNIHSQLILCTPFL